MDKALTELIDIPLGDLRDDDIIQEIIKTQSPRFTGELYDRYAHKIYRKCLSFVKQPMIAEDLTHDIFLKILLSLSSFKGRSKFSTWVYSVTYNFCIDYLRKRQKNRFSQDEFRSDMSVAEEEDVNSIEEFRAMEVRRLKEVLEQVNIDEKMLLLMKYQDDMSIKDIQQVFDLSESAVKMRIKRAKEKVRKLYKKN